MWFGSRLSDRHSRLSIPSVLAIGVDFAAFQGLLLLHVRPNEAQLISLAVAAVFAFVADVRSKRHRLAGESVGTARSVPVRFVTLVLTAGLFRGGIVSLAEWAGIIPQLTILPGIAASSLVIGLGNRLNIVRPRATQATSGAPWLNASVCICLFSFALKIVYMGQIALTPEEAYYWNYAQHPALGYLDHPPMVAWLIGAGTALFGNNEFGVRLFAPFLGLITTAFAYALARNMVGRAAAFVAVLLISVLPYFFGVSFFMLPDTPLAAAWAAALYFLERCLLGERRAAWWGVGASLGLGMVSKYSIVLLGPAAMLFAAVDRDARRWFRRPEPYLAAALAAILFTPVLVWGAQHHWASFVFQGPRRIVSKVQFGLPALVAEIVTLLGPTGAVGAGLALLERWPATTPDRRRKTFQTIFASIPLAVFGLFSLAHMPALDWTGPIWLALVPALAADFASNGGQAPDGLTMLLKSWVRRAWPVTIAALLLLYAAALHYLALGLPGIPGANTLRLPVGWSEFAQQALKIGDAIEGDTGERPVFVGLDHYNLASEMAFYGRGPHGEHPDVDSAELFGNDGGLMYQYWNSPSDREGRTLVLLAYGASAFTLPLIAAQCDTLGPVEEHKLRHSGGKAGTFFSRICHGYRSSPRD